MKTITNNALRMKVAAGQVNPEKFVAEKIAVSRAQDTNSRKLIGEADGFHPSLGNYKTFFYRLTNFDQPMIFCLEVSQNFKVAMFTEFDGNLFPHRMFNYHEGTRDKDVATWQKLINKKYKRHKDSVEVSSENSTDQNRRKTIDRLPDAQVLIGYKDNYQALADMLVGIEEAWARQYMDRLHEINEIGKLGLRLPEEKKPDAPKKPVEEDKETPFRTYITDYKTLSAELRIKDQTSSKVKMTIIAGDEKINITFAENGKFVKAVFYQKIIPGSDQEFLVPPREKDDGYGQVRKFQYMTGARGQKLSVFSKVYEEADGIQPDQIHGQKVAADESPAHLSLELALEKAGQEAMREKDAALLALVLNQIEQSREDAPELA